jgi:hypothetical protein
LPVLYEGQVKAVIELASVQEFTASHLAFLEQRLRTHGRFDGVQDDADRFGQLVERYSPQRDRAEFERAWKEHAAAAVSRVLTYEPHYEGSPVILGPANGVSSAHGTYTFEARAGHHLPSQLLSSGRNVFEELGVGFSLLAFDAEDRAIPAFELAARSLGRAPESHT